MAASKIASNVGSIGGKLSGFKKAFVNFKDTVKILGNRIRAEIAKIRDKYLSKDIGKSNVHGI